MLKTSNRSCQLANNTVIPSFQYCTHCKTRCLMVKYNIKGNQVINLVIFPFIQWKISYLG